MSVTNPTTQDHTSPSQVAAPAPTSSRAARPRIEFVDVAKGIAILSIVAGHVGFINPDAESLLVRIVFPYHVPVFYLIAGYFLTDHQPFVRFAKQKARRLLVPYVLTCLFIVAVVAFLSALRGTANPPTIYTTARDALKASLYGSGTLVPEGFQIIGAIWYLEALFIALLEMRLLIGHEVLAPIVVLALGVGSALTAQDLGIWLPFNIQSGFFGGLFVYVGHLMKRAELMGRPWRTSTVIAFAAALACVYVWGVHKGCLTYAVQAYPGANWLGIPFSVCASVLVLCASWLIDRYAPPAKRFLAWWGKNSLDVLCVHLVCLDCGLAFVLTKLGVPCADPYLFLATVGCMLALSYAFVKVKERVRPYTLRRR